MCACTLDLNEYTIDDIRVAVERERKKAEKDAKFKAKQDKQSAATASAPSKAIKEKKREAAKEDRLPEYVEETPKGQKKILRPLDDPYVKAYIPKVVESAWYDWWEAEGFFKPEFGPDGKVKDTGSFVIVEPPPNVTGV